MQSIICVNCGKEIEISEALSHQVTEEVVKKARLEAQQDAETLAKKQFEFEKEKLLAQVADSQEQAKKLQHEILSLTQEIRAARRDSESQALEMEKRLSLEEDKIRLSAMKEAQEREELKLKAKEKTIEDLQKALSDAQRKASQGSQQTQGEVLELNLEESLTKTFPQDEVREVPKGIRGADLIHVVKDRNGAVIGTIIWETKNAKWSPGWIEKLKEDQRAAKADIAILATVNLPEDIEHFSLKSNVWVTSTKSMLELAQALRFQLYQVATTKASVEKKSEQVELLYNYFTSPEFVHRIESIMESFESMRGEIDRERKWFTAKWERQEKIIQKALTQTSGMYGSLSGVVEMPASRLLTGDLGDES
jgi:hypothetical protein